MNRFHFDPTKYKSELTSILKEVLSAEKMNPKRLRKILSKYPKDGNRLFTKNQLINGFRYLQEKTIIDQNIKLPQTLQKKPTRTISGVTTVTVLTKPFPCPGKCIFCPNDITMPKSYIASEPGAQRALNNKFSPYLQVYNRLRALNSIGHPTEKIELLILGGTWSYYPRNYQVWFVKECFRALNKFNPKKIHELPHTKMLVNTKKLNEEYRKKTCKSNYNSIINSKEYIAFKEDFIEDTNQKATWKQLFHEHKKNETSHARCVGLVLETRPDALNEKEVLNLRKFGATKIQIGVQTLNEKINFLNKRLETKKQITKAFNLLRLAGFKVHAHMMPNLYGATPEIDRKSYKELFRSKNFKPDEVKIYPTSIIKYTRLYDLFKQKKYKPYSTEQLIDLIAKHLEMTPEYCRISRVIRDIPAAEIEKGNKTSNLRELVKQKLEKENRRNSNIRAREIRDLKIEVKDLLLDKQNYETTNSYEYFVQFITKQRKIAGFIRLSLPKGKTNPITSELNDTALIREIHIYGPSLEIGKREKEKLQHLGLGAKLIKEALRISRESGYKKISVISAIGTREYYRRKGFKDGKLYQYKKIN